MTNDNFDADTAAATIIDNEPDLDSPKLDGHPDDVRDAFRAIAEKMCRGEEPTGDDLVAETDDYWIASYGADQTAAMEGFIADALPEERGDYRDTLEDKYVRILRQLVTGLGHSKQVSNADAPSHSHYPLIHVKSSAYGGVCGK